MNYKADNRFKIVGGSTEQGLIVGNVFDKYNSRNPVVRRIMRGFMVTLMELVTEASPHSIYEAGCGEGFWVLHWNQQGVPARGSDVSTKAIEIARANAHAAGFSEQIFNIRSIYELSGAQDTADLIVCCEVMEHLDHPEEALRILQNLQPRHVILSVPHEPLWRILNMIRGKYWKSYGNTPGHIQHWNTKYFLAMVKKYFTILEVCHPLPWIMVLAKPL